MVDFDKVKIILTWVGLEFTSRLCSENDPSYKIANKRGEDYFLETKLYIWIISLYITIYVWNENKIKETVIIKNVFLCNFALINGQNESTYTN